MTNISCSPLVRVRDLDPEKAEATVALCVHLTAINGEALRDGGFHLGDGSGGFPIDIGRGAVAAMHDERALIHSSLRGGNEIQVVRSTCPGGVNVRIWMEDGL